MKYFKHTQMNNHVPVSYLNSLPALLNLLHLTSNPLDLCEVISRHENSSTIIMSVYIFKR